MTNEDKLRDYLTRSLEELRQTRSRLQQLQQRWCEPTAIVGAACRFPGGITSLSGLWDVLVKGEDLSGPLPTDRGWDVDRLFDPDPDPDRPGKSYVRTGCFLDDADQFDAEFFGISPREAAAIDPQQRLLLETTWKALEDARIRPATLRGSTTGVFIGATAQDYGPPLEQTPPDLEGYLLTGDTVSMASGRLAYFFGFEGPAITVDTACSSSLVAVHLAGQALRAGDCDLAVAGGVTVMSTPKAFIEFSRQRGLAPDGRCKPFAAAADGTARGEGAGVFILERLTDARRNGHRVLAVIRGSAVNSDGTSNGLTAPNGPSQQRVIGQALVCARLTPADVDVLEAHGTGTTLGDLIEAEAVMAGYGRGRDRPLWVGSIKSNLAHTQHAAGAAGVLKMMLAMRHGLLPRTLQVDRPMPQLDWSGSGMSLLTTARPWPDTGRPRRAAVSSFGISGTNAHLILEQSPDLPDDEPPSPPPGLGDSDVGDRNVMWALSATTEPALRDQARRLHRHVSAHPELGLVDIGFSLVTTRTAFDRRAVVLGANRAELLVGLDDLANQKPSSRVVEGAVGDGKTAFLFTGYGGQRPGMGRELSEAFPAFAEALDEVCEDLSHRLDHPLRTVMFAEVGSADAAHLDQAHYALPALFAFEVALYRLITSWGVTPGYLIGHSIGELAAAHVAGVLSLPDACDLVAASARLMRSAPPSGVMIAVQASEAEAAAQLVPGASIAAVDGPDAVVISGDEDAVAATVERFTCIGRETRRLRSSHAFHSAHMDAVAEHLTHVAANLSHAAPEILIVSTVTGRITTGQQWGPAHWGKHVRRTVRFHDGIRALVDEGVSRFVEIGPDGVLAGLCRACVSEDETERMAIIPCQRSARSEADSVHIAMARLHVDGGVGDWLASTLEGGRAVDLPSYPFQRTRYWRDRQARTTGAGMSATSHPLLDALVCLADGGVLLTGLLSPNSQPWLRGHAILGRVLLPGTALVELAAWAGDRVGCAQLDELTLTTPLTLPDQQSRQVQVRIDAPDKTGRRQVGIYSRADTEALETPWLSHAVGMLATSSGDEPSAVADGAWPPGTAQAVDIDDLYPRLAATGAHYGPVFRGLRAVWRAGEDFYAEAHLPVDTELGGFALHPALCDAVLHAVLTDPEQPLELPYNWAGVRIHATDVRSVRAHLTRVDKHTLRLRLTDSSGVPVATVAALTTRPVDLGHLDDGGDPATGLLHTCWNPIPASSAPEAPSGPYAVIGSELPGMTAAVVSSVKALHARIRTDAPTPGTIFLPCAADGSRPTTELRRVLSVVQDWLTAEHFEGSQLVVLTQGAVRARTGDTVTDLAGASIWGLIRSAQSEHPRRFLLIDTDRGGISPDTVRAALACGEAQLAIRDHELLMPRLSHLAAQDTIVPPDSGWRLEPTGDGTADGITAVTVPPREPGPAEIKVAMRTVGLNFRDVLISMGLYPGDAALGSEGAGVVTAVGAGVHGICVGDRVLGLFSGAITPFAVTDHRLVAPVPPGWTFTEAAAVPIVFLTAYQALSEMAAARRGESVLVHAAAGGVGMAAVMLARHWGLEVYATASPGKWAALRALGLDDQHISSSRTLEFADRIRNATDGHGVDIVLNSLTGDFTDASLGLLCPGGRFIDLGKTDVRDPADVAAGYPDVSYQSFDLTETAPDRIQQMLTEVLDLFAGGRLRPPPIRTWDVRRAREAFRFLSAARHIGKIVLTVPTPLDPEGTVLITGGAGTLGALVARHLVDNHGVRHLVLIGRDLSTADRLRTELRTLGADVVLAQCDVADRAALAEVVTGISPDHPLTAVIHAAGVLREATVHALTPEHISDVFGPKAGGAWNLHELTRDHDLSAFVLFSSVAGLLGSPGQGAYAAANVLLDGLAEYRQAHGLPAVSIAWGPWAAPGGITDQDRGDAHRFSRYGMAALPVDDGLRLFDEALTHGFPSVVSAKLELAGLTSSRAPAMLRGLVGSHSRPAGLDSSDLSLARRLVAQTDAECRTMLLDLVRRQAAAVLGHRDPHAIRSDLSFKELAFDSLTAVEFRNRLAKATGMRLPATLSFDHPTPLAVVEHLLSQLREERPVTTRAVSTPAPDEAVAIIGMSCRYPGGVRSPGDLWDLVASGTDATGDLPEDRGWNLSTLYHPDPDHIGTSYTRQGSFLDDAAGFDAAFFNISAREATAMDPQQRLLLELAWETMEHAGIDPRTLHGSDTGAFIGAVSQDYGPRAGEAPPDVEGYLLTGTTTSVASGRLAYTFGWEGPAITVDTACSSSLVALHLAAQALRRGECSLAMVGGAAVNVTPALFIEFSRQRGLAPDGRCKAFADSADGTAWGEGAGVILVERLTDARRNGHRVLAVVAGSAVNQDGASNGLTAPHGPSQQRVIRRALADAGLAPGDVDAVEAHGTGTTLGDPIEAQALLATYGQQRHNGQPLLLGSIKSNIGHTAAAAGIAGVIKMVMAMCHGVLPRTLHVDSPTRHVDWSPGAVSLLTEQQPWPRTGTVRRAAVSSFGISGTNAHLILEQAPTDLPAAPDSPLSDAGAQPAVAWPISAKTEPALRAQASQLHDFLIANPQTSAVGIARALSVRTSFDHRAAVIGVEHADLLSGLNALAQGKRAQHVVRGTTRQTTRTVFVFPGHGSQWRGMSVALFDASAVFREHILLCAEAFRPHLSWNLIEALRDDELDRDDIIQPALFAVLVSLARMWRSHGVEPDAVVGHSLGEIAAATVAGALTLDDAARLVSARSQEVTTLTGGGLLLVHLPAAEVHARLDATELSIAAINGPASTVVSGEVAALDRYAADCESSAIRTQRIPIAYASHSPHIERIRDTLLRRFGPITPRSAQIPFYSTGVGEPVNTAELDAGYWYRNLRHTVEFDKTIETLLRDEHTLFVEVSPHPVLTPGIQERIDQTGADATVVGTLRRGDAAMTRFLTSLATAHAHGADVDWCLPAAPSVDLPTYPFQHRTYWIHQDKHVGDTHAPGLGRAGHPLLGTVVELAEDRRTVLTGQLNRKSQTWLVDHAVFDSVLLPGTAFLDLALYGARHIGYNRIAELVLENPLFVAEHGTIDLQLSISRPDKNNGCSLSIWSRPTGENREWEQHATGRITTDTDERSDRTLRAWPPSGATAIDASDAYEHLSGLGYVYGPSFRGLRAAWRHGTDLYVEVALPEGTDHRGFILHPALLDATLHLLPLHSGELRLPFAWRGISQHGTEVSAVRARVSPQGAGTFALLVADSTGTPILEVESVTARLTTPEKLIQRTFGEGELLRLAWPSLTPAPVPPAQHMVVIGPAESPPCAALAAGHAPDLATLSRAVSEGTSGAPDVVILPIHAAGAAADALTDAYTLTENLLTSLTQWLADSGFTATRLVVVTKRATATSDSENVHDLAGAAVWGLVRSAQTENPGRITLVDLDDSSASWRAVPSAVASDAPQLAIRGGTILQPRLMPVTTDSDNSVVIDPDGTILITGGTGTLGSLLARHLVTHHQARHVVLLSRHGPSAPTAPQIEHDLTERGAQVTIRACDVADRSALTEVIEAVPEDHPLTAVIHCAGTLDDGLLSSLTPASIRTVFGPKVDAAWHLHDLTRELDLTAFILYSSAAGVLGSPGQANYAAANSFLDGLAHQRRCEHRPAISLAWGLWAETSALTQQLTNVDRNRIARAAVRPLTTERGLTLFDKALTNNIPMGAALDLNYGVLRQLARQNHLPPIFREIVDQPSATSPALPTETLEFLQHFTDLTPEDRVPALVDLVRTQAAIVLGFPPDEVVEDDLPFPQMGFNSLSVTELRNHLNDETGLQLSIAAVFDNATLQALAEFINREMGTTALPARDGDRQK
jgi:polyketide synthase 12